MWRWAWNSPASTTKTRTSSTPSRRTTATWSARPLVACLVQAADAISAARPGARRENLENYIKRLEKLEEITSSYPGVEKSYAIQAGREVRVMVKPEQVSEDEMVILARELAKQYRERAGIPRPDQGTRPARDEGRGVREIKI